MENLIGNVSQLIQHNPWLAVIAVFIGGITTASNPCVLAMIPLMMSVVAGYRETTGLKKSLVFSLLFIAGLSITFTVLGLISGLMGRMFGDVGRFWKYLVAGTSMGAAKRLIESKGVRKANFILQKAAGIIIILVGIYFLL